MTIETDNAATPGVSGSNTPDLLEMVNTLSSQMNVLNSTIKEQSEEIARLEQRQSSILNKSSGDLDGTGALDVAYGEAGEWRKYETYSLKTDPDQDDKASEIRLCNFSRPHMRAFHMNWWGFFMAFFIWFAIAPLLKEIQHSLKLTKQEVWTSSVVGVAGTIFMRFLLGPMCDKFGPRIPFVAVLVAASIPVACTGFVNTASGLYVLRLFIGIAGGSFVMCQYWTSRMFTKEVVGTANAIVAGWGNLGGGVTHLVMGTMLFPLFKLFFDGNAEMAWRTVCIVPAVVTSASSVLMYYFSEDSPRGNYGELKKHGLMGPVSASASFRRGALNFNTWVMFVQYACSFGVELTMYNGAALYFAEEFGQSTESAAAIASIFGWLNLFARGLGGYISDYYNARYGMRGRIWVQTTLLACEGGMVFVFASTGSLGFAIAAMTIFSLFVQAANGSCFGIVPYIDPSTTGSISGIVGAGGNVGAVAFGMGFRQLSYKNAFFLMGTCILISALSSLFIFIKGHSGLICGQDDPINAKRAVLDSPEPEDDSDNDENAPAAKKLVDSSDSESVKSLEA